MTPEVKKGIPLVAKVGAGIGAATLAGAIVFGATRPPETAVVVPPTPTPSAASATPERTPTPTVAVTRSPEPTPTKTPEVKSAPCFIFEQKYCDQTEVTNWQVSSRTYTFVGLNVPQGERIPVYAAVDGRLLISKESSKEFKGTSAAVKAVTGEVYDLKGNIDTSRFGNVVDLSVKAGDVIGYVQSTNDKNLGSYDAVYTISKAGTAGPESQINKLREMFTLAFSRPSKTYVSLSEPKSGTGTSFQDSSK